MSELGMFRLRRERGVAPEVMIGALTLAPNSVDSKTSGIRLDLREHLINIPVRGGGKSSCVFASKSFLIYMSRPSAIKNK